MKLVLVFFVVAILFNYISPTNGQTNTLNFWVQQNIYCFTNNMYKYLNSTKLVSKLNGTLPYTLFSICNPNTVTPPTLNTTVLNYHLVSGINAVENLPADGVLVTDTGDTIRVTLFQGTYIFNGVQPFLSQYGAYWGAANTINGIYYSVNNILPLPTNVTRSKILDPVSLKALGSSFSIMQKVLTLTNGHFLTPVMWSIFVPNDASFSSYAQYQKDQFTTNLNNALNLMNTLRFDGTVLAYPLSLANYNFSTTTSLTTSDGQTTYSLTASGSTYTLNGATLGATLLTPIDSLRADGVINTINQLFLPQGFVFDPPTAHEFVYQYSTFSDNLKVTLNLSLSDPLDKMIADLIAKNITIPDESTILLAVNYNYPSTPVTDVNQLSYHIISGLYRTDQFTLDSNLQTLNGDTFKIVKYNSDYYFNGFSKVLIPNVQLKNSILHVISDILVIPSPANSSCDTCYKLVDIFTDISSPTSSYQKMLKLIQANGGFNTPPPYTVLLMEDSVFENILSATFYSGLLANTRDLSYFIKQNIISGTYFPAVASNGDTVLTALDGTQYPVSYLASNPPQLNFNFTIYSSAYPRSDGIYYDLQINVVTFTPPPPTPPGSPSSTLSISVSLVLLILSCLSFFVLM